MKVVGRSRRRAGSLRWGLWNDTADPERRELVAFLLSDAFLEQEERLRPR